MLHVHMPYLNCQFVTASVSNVRKTGAVECVAMLSVRDSLRERGMGDKDRNGNRNRHSSGNGNGNRDSCRKQYRYCRQ